MSTALRNKLETKDLLNSPGYRGLQVITVEELYKEALSLTLEVKAVITLANLVHREIEIGSGILVSAKFNEPGPRLIEFELGLEYLPAIVFAAVGGEVFVILRLLEERRLIEIDRQEPQRGTTIKITPAGYIFAEQIKQGLSEKRTAFLVCRFTKADDAVYESVYGQIGRDPELKCSILRVSDTHHVERIDDQIVKDISAASVVVVDLTGSNFNVGFEAGLAFALGKPIVWTKVKDDAQLSLPFDIQSQNVMFYDPADPEDFRHRLKYRMLAALAKADQSVIPLSVRPGLAELMARLSN